MSKPPLAVSRARLLFFGISCVAYGYALAAIDGFSWVRCGIVVATICLWPSPTVRAELAKEASP